MTETLSPPVTAATSVATAPPVVSTSVPLTTGVVYSAVAVSRPATNDQPAQEGVIINGEFLEYSLPENVKSGESIKVKVQAQEPELKLNFLPKPKNTLSDNPQSVEVASLLRGLIYESENVSADLLKTLASIDPQASEKLLKLLQSSGAQGFAVNSTTLESPEALKQLFQSAFRTESPERTETLKLLRQLAESLKSAENLKEPQELKQLLVQLTEHVIPDTAAPTQNFPSRALNLQVEQLKDQQLVIEKLLGGLQEKDETELLKVSLDRAEAVLKGSKLDVSREQEIIKALKQVLSQPQSQVKQHEHLKELGQKLEVVLVKHSASVSIDADAHRAIRNVLRTVDIHLQSILSQGNSSKPVAAKDLEFLEVASQKFPELSSFLNSLKQGDQNQEKQKVLRLVQQVVLSQIEQLEVKTKEVEEFLTNLTENSSYLLVRQTLNKLVDLTEPLLADWAVKLHNFAKGLQSALDQANTSDNQTVKLVLQRASEDLRVLMQELPINQSGSESVVDPKEQVNRQAKVLLLQLQSFIDAAIGELEEEGSVPSEKTLQKLAQQLKGYSKELAAVLQPPNFKDQEVFKNFQGLQRQLENLNPTQINPREFKQLLNELKDSLPLLLSAQKVSLSADASKAMQAAIETQLSNLYGNIKKALFQTIEEPFGELFDQKINTKAAEQISQLPAADTLTRFLKLVNSAGGKTSPETLIKELLKFFDELEQNSKAGRSELDQKLLAVAEQFRPELQSSSKHAPEARQNTLHKLMGELDKLLKSTSLERAEQAGDLNRAIKGLENMLRGQETLAQAAPYLQAAGEPVFLLFPNLLGGMLSKLELTLFPPEAQLENEPDSESDHKQSQLQKGHAALELPGLGAVSFEIVHDSNQAFLKFSVADEEKARFIEKFLPKLQKRFEEQGISKLTASAGKRQVAAAQVERPVIVPALSTYKA